MYKTYKTYNIYIRTYNITQLYITDYTSWPVFSRFSLAETRLVSKVEARYKLGLSRPSLKNIFIVFSWLGMKVRLGWSVKISFKKGSRTCDSAGQSKRKWDSVSTLFSGHNLQKRSFLLILFHRPVSTSNFRVPSLSLVKRDLFFLVSRVVRYGAILKVRSIFWYKLSLFWLEISAVAFCRNWFSRDLVIPVII